MPLAWLRRLLGSAQQLPPKADSIIKEFYSTVVGVSHRNKDRTSRQKIIKEDLRHGQKLHLQFDDQNSYDPFAVAVLSPQGRQAGYLDHRLAREVRDWLGRGLIVEITITEITGGRSGKELHGINIHVRIKKPT